MTPVEKFPQPAAKRDPGKLRGRAAGILAVLCAAMFLDALDVSMMAVALPSMQRSLHMSTASLQWVISGYVLGYGGVLLLGGPAGGTPPGPPAVVCGPPGLSLTLAAPRACPHR